MSAPVAEKAPNPFSKAEQARFLAGHHEVIKAASFAMKRAVDANDTKEALKHAARVLSELRTSSLTPKSYYDVYMQVFDALSFMELHFSTLQRAGVRMAEVYEQVQAADNVLVRLYLMITAGSVYIRSHTAPAKDVLADLLECVKGVQHPTRGLFLRYYLAQKCKDKLPDVGSAYEGAGGSIFDAISFLLTNFGEMNRLWVRIGHAYMHGLARSKKRRERERLDIRILVTAPITRLSNLGGLDVGIYKEHVLPRLLSEVVQCKDRVAQQYLLETIIQVFPVEYHYETLPLLLENLHAIIPDHVVVKSTVLALLKRIKEAAQSYVPADGAAQPAADDKRIPGLPRDLDVFNVMLTTVNELALDSSGPFRNPSALSPAGLAAQASTGDADAANDTPAAAPSSENLLALRNAANVASGEAIASMLEVYTALLSFALACYPGYLPHFDSVLGAAVTALREILGGPVAAASNSKTAPGQGAVGRSALSRLTSDAAAKEEEETAEAPAAEDTEAPVSAPEGDSPSAASSPSRGKRRALNLNDECAKLVVGVLSLAQAALGLDVLLLENYPSLMAYLHFQYRRSVANKLLEAVLAAGQLVRSPEIAKRLLTSLGPLLRDEQDVPPDGGDDDKAAFVTEQHNVARLLHLFGGTTDASIASSPAVSAGGSAGDSDTDTHFQVYLAARDFLSHGGSRRMAYTFPPLVNGCLLLARRIHALELANVAVRTPSKRVFQILHELCMALATTHTELALRLFLQCALSADALGFAYDFFAKAFVLYEEIVESRVQLRTLTLMITSLHSSVGMEIDNYENLCARCTTLAVKLLKKPDSVRCILLCAKLFWRSGMRALPEYHRPKEVLKCLQKTLKIADECMPAMPVLFVEILDVYVYFFEKRCPSVLAKHITDLIALAREQAEAMRPGTEREDVLTHLRNTLAHITAAKAAPDSPYRDVTV